MVYGKFRNGPTSIGRQAANWLQDGQEGFRTRRRGDVIVRQGGEFTNILQGPVKFDGFYAIGEVIGNGSRIVGSADCRTFSDRGPAPTSGGFDTAQLAYYGRGIGSVVKNTFFGYFLDFDGKDCPMNESALQLTRNGRTLKDYYTLPSFGPFGGFPYTITYTLGGYRPVAGGHEFYSGVSLPMLLDGGQHVQAYIYDNGVGQEFGATPYFPNQLGWYASTLVLAPGVFLKMDRYLRPHYSGSGVAAGASPGLDFNYSTDAGLTWASCSSVEMFAEEMDTIIGIPPDIDKADSFNSAIGYAEILAAPLSRSLSVAVACVPYVVPQGDGFVVRAKAKIGLINVAAGCSITSTQTLYDGNPQDALLYISRGVMAIKGGVLVFIRPVVPDHAQWNFPARIFFTPNGTDLVERATFPFKENRTGKVQGLNEKILTCAMYDGEHSVYQSKDFGVSWTKRGVIHKNGVPPNDAPLPDQEEYSLKSFNIITFLRKDNVPVPAYPATPWLTDSRVPDPSPI
ncbi:hypothetical protein [Variovorax paradoxus]|uniref:hypothetical protein n=1 Tax=Variovorax paradoxus TaxID=34073 RepID=UPI00285A8FB1|nr:hypothetical protein [Variovorax paradoxus]MDR6453890.1 hypothetical protein [Variovorax paradoxus]